MAFVRVDCAEPWALRTQLYNKPADCARIGYPLLVGVLYAVFILQLRKEKFLRDQVCSSANSTSPLLELTVFVPEANREMQ